MVSVDVTVIVPGTSVLVTVVVTHGAGMCKHEQALEMAGGCQDDGMQVGFGYSPSPRLAKVGVGGWAVYALYKQVKVSVAVTWVKVSVTSCGMS